jgi:two-component system, NarL family, capsular synthesis sensor histidine kinase RcsC
VAKIKHIMSQGNQHGQRAYDAVLMDFIMPNMNGPTATEEIRSLGYTAPIFGVTGNGLATDIEYFKNSGVDTVLLKPLSIVSFYDAMTQFSGTKTS